MFPRVICLPSRRVLAVLSPEKVNLVTHVYAFEAMQLLAARSGGCPGLD